MRNRAIAASRTGFDPMAGAGVLLAAVVLLLAQAFASIARAQPEGFADLAEKVSPAVVDITTTTLISSPAGPGEMVPPGSPFEDFFNDFLNRDGEGEPRPRRNQALGSGFVISEDGYIVTNNHVIEGSDEIQIEFIDGSTLPAKVVGTDPKTDIALLKVESEAPLAFVRFGDSDLARVGDWVLAVGNPLGQGFSVSAGIISARKRELNGTYDDFLQTDAAINRGNSGGPLFNMDGEVIGVNTAILSPTGGSIGIGFSMASNVVSKVVDQLRKYGETRRGWLGVRIQDITPDMAEAMGLESTRGALVTDVPDGPAKDAGVQQGDVILSFDGREIENTRDLVRMVGDAEVGKAARLVVWRDGKTVTLKVVLGRREEAEAAQNGARNGGAEDGGKAAPAEKQILGLTLSEITDGIREEMGLGPDAGGLLIKAVDESSPAFEKGLRPGDLIAEVAQQKIETIRDFEKRIEEVRDAGRKSVLLLVRRAGEPRFVALPVK